MKNIKVTVKLFSLRFYITVHHCVCAVGKPAFINMISRLSPNFLQHFPVTLDSNIGDDTLLRLLQSPIKEIHGHEVAYLQIEQFEHV
jgi:hypothetical protein